jgi:hypothetical protein
MSMSAPFEGEGTSPFEPDVNAPATDPHEGQRVATPDIKKMGEFLGR